MRIRDGTTADFQQIVCWQYAPPYDVYTILEAEWEETIVYFAKLGRNFVIMANDDDTVIGFASFGEDGQVPGGDYTQEALDIGMGMRPDLNGRGHGPAYLAAVLDYAQENFHPTPLRATIASFNQRAQNMVKRAGFVERERFTATNSGREFAIFVKEAS